MNTPNLTGSILAREDLATGCGLCYQTSQKRQILASFPATNCTRSASLHLPSQLSRSHKKAVLIAQATQQCIINHKELPAALKTSAVAPPLWRVSACYRQCRSWSCRSAQSLAEVLHRSGSLLSPARQPLCHFSSRAMSDGFGMGKIAR
jgi:hypothetical protein